MTAKLLPLIAVFEFAEIRSAELDADMTDVAEYLYFTRLGSNTALFSRPPNAFGGSVAFQISSLGASQ